MRITILMALAAAGCSFHTSNSSPTDGQKDGRNDGPSDGPIDSPPDTPPQQDFGSGAWQVHVDLPVPTNTLTLPMMIDTGAASADCMTNVHWVDQSQPDSCFIVAQTINTNMDVKIRGPNIPMVLRRSAGARRFSLQVSEARRNAREAVAETPPTPPSPLDSPEYRAALHQRYLALNTPGRW